MAATTNNLKKSEVLLRRLYRSLMQEGRRIDRQSKQHQLPAISSAAALGEVVEKCPRISSDYSVAVPPYLGPTPDISSGRDDDDDLSPFSLTLEIRKVFRRSGRSRSSGSESDGEELLRRRQDSIKDAMEVLRVLMSIDINDYADLDSSKTSKSLAVQTEEKPQPKHSTEHDQNENNVNEEDTERTDIKDRTLNMDWWLEQVEWLPNMSTENFNEKEEVDKMTLANIIVPVFPLSGPVLFSNVAKNDDEDANDTTSGGGSSNNSSSNMYDEKSLLPLISYFSHVPMMGQKNIPLRIFEPRYRRMYRDLLSSTSSKPEIAPPDANDGNYKYNRSFIVPFAHPIKRGTFARWGMLYEIQDIEDVADQTSGRIALVCTHKVTRPVQIKSIVNPAAWKTQDTYLRATIVPSNFCNDIDMTSGETMNNLGSLKELLQNAIVATDVEESDEGRKNLARELLHVLDTGGFWAFVDAWIYHQQTQILYLQSRIADRVWRQAEQSTAASSLSDDDDDDDGDNDDDENAEDVFRKTVTDEMILLAQKPHRIKLQSMFTEVSTLIPLLLQKKHEEEQCDWMCKRLEAYFRVGKKGRS